MKKRIAAIVLCVFCLLAIAGCSQSKPDAQTAQPTAAQETGDYLTTISGTYEELFPQLATMTMDLSAPIGFPQNSTSVGKPLLRSWTPVSLAPVKSSAMIRYLSSNHFTAFLIVHF